VGNGVSEGGNSLSGVGITDSEGGISVSEEDFGVTGREIPDSVQNFVVSEPGYRHKSPQI
jgi:hypothetical protein